MATARQKHSRRKADASFTIHFETREPSDEDLSVIVEAPNAGAARRQARDRFPDETIIGIEKGTSHRTGGSYPNARFIKGRFRPADSADDPTLFTLTK